MAEDGAALLLKALEQIKIEAEVLKPQNDMEATYTKLIKKENGKVSFIDNTSTEIYNMWRAYNPWPGIYTDYANTENRQEIQKSGIVVQLKEISVFPDNYPVAGLIIQSDKQNLVVSCKEGSLKLMKLKPSGKNEMDFVSFINGYKPVTGRFF
jgi:methionyl-tRNA formyltransferase